ncbi:MAG: methylamine methyltransferase corrinoid protein reductive activase [Methanomassiliicoccaceae archaeon]|jgi:methylamine methyltransferase corrinoid protein reductive activase|nr:methylamine methyltransferase corrinoid protein reductive activase [Methanomassiliicoccaceae archaeon]
MVSYGIALDLGTSGFRSHLVDIDKGGKILSTAVTVRHPLPGANIMDHLHFWMTSGSKVGHKIIMKTVDDVIRLHGADSIKNIKKVAICGNPIQLSLFENIEVRDLAYAGENRLKTLGVVRPSRRGHTRKAGDIGMLSINPETEVIIPPAIRHEIGADALAMIMRSGMLDKKEICMVTDYGTNAEMGLYYDGELYSGSAAAGPAMEGQSIKYGVLAAPHAISDVNMAENGLWENLVLDDKLIPIVASKVDPSTGKEVRILNYSAKGITGTGVVSSMAMGLQSGIIKLPNISTPDGKIHLMDGIWFSESDVQEAGKAMGAIRAGHRTLLHEVGIGDEDIRVMYMAGASGTYVDPIKAQICGMIPRRLDEVYQLGNTSLMMAHDLIKDDRMLDRMQSVADSISSNHIMFATNKTFEDMYVLELAYWTEGMSLEMYNDMIVMSGHKALPPIKVPSKVVRIAKSDIPEIGRGFFTLEEVGMKMHGNFKGCTGCKKCEKGCPEKALTVIKGPEIIVRSDLCLGTACKACEMSCPEKVYKFSELKVSL